MKGVTDKLIMGFEKIEVSPINEVIQKHNDVLEHLGKDPYVEKIKELLKELYNIFQAYKKLGIKEKIIHDMIVSYGERLSINILASVLAKNGNLAAPLYGRQAGIVTNERYGEAVPTKYSCTLVRSKMGNYIKNNVIPVIAGFIGETSSGRLTTMGRGGSDFTATYIGKCVRAGEVHLVTDIEGIMTGDPRFFDNVERIPVLSYDEAIELAYLGGKKFHPKTFEPLRETSIVTRVSSLETDKGTVIVKNWRDPPLKAVTLINNLEIIMIKGAGMVGRLGTAAEIMRVFSEGGINIMAISQPISETSINLVVRRGSIKKIKDKLDELVNIGFIREYDVLKDTASASLIGYGLRNPKLIGDMVGVLKGHDVFMLAKGPMEVSLSVVASENEAKSIAGMYHDIVVEGIKRTSFNGFI